MRTTSVRQSALALILLLVLATRVQAQVVINEVMYQPSSGSPEWVELLSVSDSAVDLNGWTIHDLTFKPKLLGAFTVAPGSHVVFTADSSTLRQNWPGDYGILQLALPSLNNTGDALVLSQTGVVVDSVQWLSSWGGNSGRSLERIDPRGPSTSKENFTTSTDTTGATPGTPNSQRRRRRDLAILDVSPLTSDEVAVSIVNRGYENANAFRVELAGEVVDVVSDLAAGESRSLTIPAKHLPLGYISVSAKVHLDGDEQVVNDSLTKNIVMPVAFGSVAINEIMSDPAINDCEWIELVNTSTRPVSLTGFLLSSGYKRTLPSAILQPEAFVVASANERIRDAHPDLLQATAVLELKASSLGISNSGATITLRSSRDELIDSVLSSTEIVSKLLPTTKGVSLERRSPKASGADPVNWRSSTDLDGSTPLRPNSTGGSNEGQMFSVVIEPNPVALDDGDEPAKITVEQSGSDQALVRILLLDRRGRLVRTVCDGVRIGAKGRLPFVPRDEDGRTLAPGLYILKVEAQGENGTQTKTAGVAVARRY